MSSSGAVFAAGVAGSALAVCPGTIRGRPYFSAISRSMARSSLLKCSLAALGATFWAGSAAACFSRRSAGLPVAAAED